MPAPQTAQENCVAHNGSLIPIPGRDVMVQALYQGGLSVFDWTDVKKPKEIAFFDRGPVDATRLVTGRLLVGLLVQRRASSAPRSRAVSTSSSCCRAGSSPRTSSTRPRQCVSTTSTPRNSRRLVWPPSFALARAFLDQLQRSNGLAAARITAVRNDLASAERMSGAERVAALTRLATQLTDDAGRATDRVKTRMLADAVKDLSGAQR